MAVNPDTNRIEPLTEVSPGIDSEILNLQDRKALLLRPDGSIVPSTWTTFKMGELVTIKDYTFRVAYIGETNMLFELVKPDVDISSGIKAI